MTKKYVLRRPDDPDRWRDESGAMRDALRARELRKGPPTEADIPPPQPLPGPKHKPLAGQLDLYGNEAPGPACDLDERGDDA